MTAIFQDDHRSTLASLLRRARENWIARGRIARLEVLDDRMLSDIGLDRADLRWAARLPFGNNAESALLKRLRRPGGVPWERVSEPVPVTEP